MMPVGDGSFYLYLHNDVRRPTNTGVGDVVSVGLSFHADYRGGPQHDMPPYLAAALAGNATAAANWARLPPSRKKEVLRYFSRLKSIEAEERNLARLIEVLEGHERRFLARLWSNGS